MFYLELFRKLHENHVRYMVVGGLALTLHGIPRSTMDIDLIVALDEANLRRFLDVAKALQLRPVAPVSLDDLARPAMRESWVTEKNMIAFAMRAAEPSSPTLDVLIRPPFEIGAAVSRARTVHVGDIPVPVASIDDLIRLKESAGREQDIADIEHLKRLRGQT